MLPALVLLLAVTSADASSLGGVQIRLPLPVRPPNEVQLLNDAQDGQLEERSFLAAAMIAGGSCDMNEVACWERHFETLCHDLTSAAPVAGDGAVHFDRAEQLRQIHELLHRQVLTGPYKADCAAVQQTLQRGEFNCVTATVLFHCLAERCGVQTSIAATPTHMFARAEIPGAAIPFDIQTTCSTWPSPARRSSSATESSASSPTGPSLRTLTPVQVVAKIFYNRGVAALKNNDFAVAVLALQAAVQLDPHDLLAKENLAAGINNWALATADVGELTKAIDLVLAGLQLSPHYQPLLANDIHLHQQWALQLCESGQYREALRVLSAGKNRRPDVALFTEGETAVYLAWSRSFAQARDWERARQVLTEGLTSRPDSAALLAARTRLEHRELF